MHPIQSEAVETNTAADLLLQRKGVRALKPGSSSRKEKKDEGNNPPAQSLEYVSTKKTETVISHLEARIAADEWRDGNALPSRGQLSKEYGVSPATIANAIRTLQKKGLLRVVAGKGAFVNVEGPTEKPMRPTIALGGSYVRSRLRGLPNSYASAIVQSIWDIAHDEHCPLLLLPGMEKGEGMTRETLERKGVHGVVFLGGESFGEAAALRAAGFPVIIANEPVGPTALNYINYDHGRCLRDAVKLFTSHGHERIGVIVPSTSMPGSFEKLKPNFIQALYDAGIQYNINNYWRFVEREPDPTDEFRQVPYEIEAMLDLPEPPTAIFCWTSAAIGHILKVLEKRKLKVPQDISLAYFPYNPEAYPQLSGYYPDHHQLAQELLKGLYATIENPFHCVQKLIPLRFCDHGTIAAAPRRV